MLLLPLHPPVLEPDLNLPLTQTEGVGNFDSTSSSQVAVEVELFLQLQCLISSVGRALSFGFAHRVDAIYKKGKTQKNRQIRKGC